MSAVPPYRRVVCIGLALLLHGFLFCRSAKAADLRFDGEIAGIELCPQFVCGAAWFVFEFQGTVNEKPRSGWGLIAVTHGDVPDEFLEFSPITGGKGIMWIGGRVFHIDVREGTLQLVDLNGPEWGDEDFGVIVTVAIWSFLSPAAEHSFGRLEAPGILSHEPLIPTIAGPLEPVAP